jgi:RNA polymerase sigma-70 factor, ECF subfamily
MSTGTDEQALLDRARSGDEGAFTELVQAHRGELRAYCYRMLGSVHDADDALQDALVRAWRGLPGFQGRGTVRSWLYSIATNTALDVTRHKSRRELPVTFGPAADYGTPVAGAMTEPVWLEPYPDHWLEGGPEARYEQREAVELAFMIMLQQLPPLQRAVLILRDVLGFSPAEMASQLGTSEAAVNSALQRARAAARAGLPARSQQAELRALGSQRVSEIAARYADAIERGDADTLVSMLTEDATWCMPPMPTWYQGHRALREWLVSDPLTERWRHQATRASGQLAVGCYLYAGGTSRYRAAVIDVLTLDQGRIAAVTAFVTPWVSEVPAGGADSAEIFARFGLPAELP